MDYKPFLNRDFKTLLDPEPSKSRWQWGSLHWVVLCAFIMAMVSIFALTSKEATGVVRPTATESVQQVDVKNDSRQLIRIPLDIPGTNNNSGQEQQARISTARLDTAIEPQQPIAATDVVKDMAPLPTLNIKIKSGDSLASIFKKHNLSARTLHQIMKLAEPKQILRNIQPGKILKVQRDANNELQQLVYEMDQFNYLSIQRQFNYLSIQRQLNPADKIPFTAKQITRQTEKRIHFASGVIENSLFEDGQQSGLSTTLIMEMANIFGWDIDFALDLRKGDQFSLLFEEHFLDGVKVQDGPVLAAQFTNQGHTYKAVRFTNENGFASYYSPDGLSMRKAFLRTPVDFRRISSRFGKRRHPTLNRLRLHKGVDYAAPTGTPIRASGDGKIIYRNRRGGYGKAIIIQHGGRYSTLYAHLSGYKRGITIGKKVKQGQIIGYVGSTGRATGPHLHYEFRVNGVHRNPLTIKLPNAAPIAAKYRKDFSEHATRVLAQLDSYLPATATTRVAARSQ